VAPVVFLSLLASASPVRAQDFFGGLLRLFAPPAPVPTYQPYDYRNAPDFERPVVRRRPKPVVASEPPKMPPVPKAPGEVANPVPDLLADSTLRRGDMVMFPDGLRVFTGRDGAQHTLSDFEPLARAGKSASPETRKLLTTLQPGSNAAWSANSVKLPVKLAVSRDAQRTGSVGRSAR
jgi:hypothetical protein